MTKKFAIGENLIEHDGGLILTGGKNVLGERYIYNPSFGIVRTYPCFGGRYYEVSREVIAAESAFRIAVPHIDIDGFNLSKVVSPDWDQKVVFVFMDGYLKAKEEFKYTEKQVRKAIELAKVSVDFSERYGWSHNATTEEIIQMIQPKLKSIEVEMENDGKIKTEKIDGKEYIKITNVEYE